MTPELASGLWIVAATVGVIFGYFFAFMFLVSITGKGFEWLRDKNDGPGWLKAVLFLPLLVLALFLILLDIIHTLCFVWFGYKMATHIFGGGK